MGDAYGHPSRAGSAWVRVEKLVGVQNSPWASHARPRSIVRNSQGPPSERYPLQHQAQARRRGLTLVGPLSVFAKKHPSRLNREVSAAGRTADITPDGRYLVFPAGADTMVQATTPPGSPTRCSSRT